jgi:ATP-dependent helicase/nuclease subunit B
MTALIAAVRDLIARTTGPERGTWTEHAVWARGLIGPRPEIDSLSRFDGVSPAPTGAEFRAFLRDQLRRATRPAGATAGVQVLDAMAARGIGFRGVILLGLNERVWPRFILEDPFIPDAVRTQIKFRLGNILPEKLAGYEEERLLFEMARSSAREDLLILWQRSDDKGRVQVRSPFLDAGGIAVPRRPSVRLREAPLETLTPKEAAVRAILAGGRGEAVARAFGWDVKSFETSAKFLRAIEDDRKLGPRDGIVGPLDSHWTAYASRGFSPDRKSVV